MKLYPVLPLIFICGYLFVAGSIAVQTPMAAITSLLVLAGCMIIYFVTKNVNTQKNN
jgi:hypothetical protein